ncbi:MAG: hypothetical protein POELPBGB_00433 [Bacteroidia bacterium]|nr:hypothetical protein [Bacteroidia bacterium]
MVLLFIVIVGLGFKNETNRLLCKSTAFTKTAEYTEGLPGIIVINDFATKNSKQVNEFGNAEDWLQLHNTTGDTLQLELGKWFLTDDINGNPQKFELPEITIAPHGNLIIWCDKMDTVEDAIHTNFRIASSGEKIGLFYYTGNEYTNVAVCSN